MKLFAITLFCSALTLACSKDKSDKSDSSQETGDSEITGTDSGPPTSFLIDDSIELIRDDKGVPHIYANTQRGVYFGLGYASAQDRMFQMDFVRRKTGGSLTEFLWQEGETDFNEELKYGDIMVRTLGLRRHAERVVEGLPEEKRLILTSFTDGVNTYIKSIDQMPFLYKLKGKSEIALWTEADSILAWDYAWLYQGNPQREIANEINAWAVCSSDPTSTACVPSCQKPLDDESAIVPEEASVNWPDRKRNSSLPLAEANTTTPFKEMSHGWAVSGDHITSGKPVLAFDPKIPVWAPSLFYPFHLSGPNLEVRGMGFPGAPALLTFWNENLGQTVTSTQGDMIDLFAMTPVGTDDEYYMLDGVEKAYKLREEVIPLGDGSTHTFTVRESVWGPVINKIPGIIALTNDILAASETPAFSAKNVEHTRVDTHSVIAAMEANASNTLDEYRSAHGDWFTPYTHTIYAGVDDGEEEGKGHIAYHHTSGVPWRVSQEIGGLDYTGQHPQDGSNSQNDWTGLMTIDERPHVIDPSSGYIMAANHLTIGSWYQDFAYTGTTSSTGETFRSLILRDLIEDLLASGDTVSARDVHLIHESNTSFVTETMRSVLAYIIDDLSMWGQAPTSGQTVSTNEEKAHKLREALDAYAATGMEFVESNPYEDLVRAVTQSMKAAPSSSLLSPDFKCTWNNGITAANWIARTLHSDNGQALTDHPELIEFILIAAAGAYDWDPPGDELPIWDDDDLSTWTADEPLAFDIAFGYFGSQCSVPTTVDTPSDAECSLSQDYVIHYDALERRNKNLVSSSSDSSMPATVDFANVDAAQWLFPIGVSEDPLSDDFDSFLGEWENYSQAGDSTQSYVDAPLDRALITIRDNTPLSYWEG